MSRFASWFGKNADAVIALVLAIAVAVIGLGFQFPNEGEITNSAILAVIGLRATALLRDRGHRIPVETELRESMRESGRTLTELDEKLRHIERFEGVVSDTKRALDETAMVRVITGAQVDEALAEARRDT